MVVIYVRRIKEGIMTIEEVPPLWRDRVAAILAAQ
ncbi:CD1375 family protein [Clostridium beijerinckii]|nr:MULTISPECIES: CD1375 family protein [Clostridium]NRZ24342.1 hypothetical protein [Clostridium beijerinckii]NYB99439.1 hypothetical protein [Clostridium beijerinckii]OOM20858.1 hypothetical protein CLBEI_41610 [Clostridium beijerinckii]SQB20256.1 Uncharacterised protein [Clostridium beijerinckii]